MTDEQIIKAFSCCNCVTLEDSEFELQCNACPYNGIQNKCDNLEYEVLDLINRQKAEIKELKALVKEMSDYFPCCNDCEGKTILGERTEKCVYLIDGTNYCVKRGIENIGHILEENKQRKAEIVQLKQNLEEAHIDIKEHMAEIERLHEVINGFEEQSHKEFLAYMELSEKYLNAKSEANRKIASSITNTLIEYEYAQNWDGKLPTYMSGDSGFVPVMNIG